MNFVVGNWKHVSLKVVPKSKVSAVSRKQRQKSESEGRTLTLLQQHMLVLEESLVP